MNGGGPWAILNAVFGWPNSATCASVVAYNLYWAFVIAEFKLLGFREEHGRWPLMKEKAPLDEDEQGLYDGETSDQVAEDRSQIQGR